MHSLILGITGTGKTTLAKELSKKSPRKSIILEPVQTDGWAENAYHTSSADEVMHVAKTNKNLDIFIDESGETLCRDNNYQFLATRSRQYGHRVFFIAQRAQQVLPIIRNNCECLYVFRQSKPDCDILSRDFADESFFKCSTLKKGEYVCRIGLDSDIKRFSLFKK